MEIRVGDKVVLTEGNSTYKIREGTVGTVVYIGIEATGTWCYILFDKPREDGKEFFKEGRKYHWATLRRNIGHIKRSRELSVEETMSLLYQEGVGL